MKNDFPRPIFFQGHTSEFLQNPSCPFLGEKPSNRQWRFFQGNTYEFIQNCFSLFLWEKPSNRQRSELESRIWNKIQEKQGFEDKELKNTEKLDASNKVDFRVLRNWSTMVIKIEEQESELEKKSYYGETKEER